MTDILNLFKHDAEHKWQDGQDHIDIGPRSKVLHDSTSFPLPDIPPVVKIGRDQREQERAREKAKLKARSGEKLEHSLYGRRW